MPLSAPASSIDECSTTRRTTERSWIEQRGIDRRIHLELRDPAHTSLFPGLVLTGSIRRINPVSSSSQKSCRSPVAKHRMRTEDLFKMISWPTTRAGLHPNGVNG